MKVEKTPNPGENAAERIEKLEQRLRKLAADKSQLQLYADLINRLSLAKGVGNVSMEIVTLLMGTLGGTNITLYYLIDNKWNSIDLSRVTKVLSGQPEPEVQTAIRRKENIFIADTSDTKFNKDVVTGNISHGGTWIMPLAVEDISIGAVKMEGMLVARPDMMGHLKPFINYASIILKSEIENYSELRSAYEDIKEVNRKLTREIEERKNAEGDLLEQEKLFRSTFENAVVGICMTSVDGLFLMVNSALCTMLGYSEEELLSKSFAELTHPDDNALSLNALQSLLERKTKSEVFEKRYITKSGQLIWTTVSTTLLRDENDSPKYFITHIEDVTSRKLAEELLKANEQKFRVFFEHVTDYALVFIPSDQGPVIVDLNKAACENLGYSRQELIGQHISFLDPRSDESREEQLENVLTGEIVNFESTHRRKDGSTFPVAVTARLIDVDGQPYIFSIERNIATWKQNEKEKALLQNQLVQAQKMESVGRLAGGVAHDFNNMLGVILGHAEMIMRDLDPALPIYNNLVEISKAAQRSADLTRQLLAFARKQTMTPRVLDLNRIVEGMLQMLRRLIGEDIDLSWRPGKVAASVYMDPSQLDQILVNLCVNSRDAIADVGKITIETGTAVFDDEYCSVHVGFVPGEFVLLAVSDNGCGMDRETQLQIFEPFFTTKGQSKGTGLGLATVYGIVKQNNGFINVYSEPHEGTTFKIYLPRHISKSLQVLTEVPSTPDERGRETILLVEDELMILRMTTTMLERLGYKVVAANTPGEAIRLASEYAGHITLLMTDVVMPEMNGRDLAKNLLRLYPNLKRLFMSGYTANVIAHHGVLDKGVNFIQKPFSNKELAVKVKQALQSE